MVWAQGAPLDLGDSGDADDKNHGTRLMAVFGGLLAGVRVMTAVTLICGLILDRGCISTS